MMLTDIKHSVELLRDRKGIYGIGVAKCGEIDYPPKDLILRRDHLAEGQIWQHAVLQRITGGFRHGMFCNMTEERHRQLIHHAMLRRAGLPWPPPQELPHYWSTDHQQQSRNRQIYHGLRLGSLSIVNRLIGQALEEATDPEVVKIARRFGFRYRYPIYRAAARSSRVQQLTNVFPTLALAIFAWDSHRISLSIKEEAINLVEVGAPLKKIADLMGLPIAFRKVLPGAADWALSVSDAVHDERLIHAHMPHSLPGMKLWLRCTALAKKRGPEFVEWVAKHSHEMEGTADEVLCFINDLSDWVRACHRAIVPAHIFNAIAGDEARPSGEQFIVRRFTPEMSLKTVTKLSSEWHEAVANNLSGPFCEFSEPWCGAARACGYDILPIPNAAELYREGHAMHHCVGTHSGRALTGDAYFYSVRRDNERIATLELVRVGRRVEIGQLRGACNGQVPKTVARVVNSWLMSQREFCLPTSRDIMDYEIPF